jgi:hypothetical protein
VAQKLPTLQASKFDGHTQAIEILIGMESHAES